MGVGFAAKGLIHKKTKGICHNVLNMVLLGKWMCMLALCDVTQADDCSLTEW